MILTPRALTTPAFAPFGSFAASPAPRQREDVGPARNLRPGVPACLRWVAPRPLSLPLHVRTMERHRFSSQSFVPLAAMRWLVVVAPHAATGGPDMARAAAFLTDGRQAITYDPDTWHHPLAVLTEGARFVVLTFLDGGAQDEEFVPVTDDIRIAVA